MLVWNSPGWGQCIADPAKPGWQLLQPCRDLDAGLPASLGHGQQAEVVKDAPDPTALGSFLLSHTSQLGQGPSLALRMILFLRSGLGVH